MAREPRRYEEPKAEEKPSTPGLVPMIAQQDFLWGDANLKIKQGDRIEMDEANARELEKVKLALRVTEEG